MEQKKPYVPCQLELRYAPEKFLYELGMLRASADALSLSSILNGSPLWNIILEAALLHARNLYEFFSRKRCAKDDMLAGHFVKSKDGSFWTSGKLGYLASLKQDINKALSHLTYTRVSKKPCWDVERIRDEIEDAYAEFLALLPESERSNWST